MTSASRSFSLAQLLLVFALIGWLLSFYRTVKSDAIPLQILGASVSQDGKFLIAHTNRGLVQFSVKTGRVYNVLREVVAEPENVFFSPDSQKVATISYVTNTLSVWDLDTGRRLRSVPRGPFRLRLYGYSFEKDWALVWDYNSLGILSLNDGRTIHRFAGSTPPARLSPDGERLAMSDSKAELLLWDFRDANALRKTAPVKSNAVEVPELASTVSDEFDLRSSKPVSAPSSNFGFLRFIKDFVFSPDGKSMLVLSFHRDDQYLFVFADAEIKHSRFEEVWWTEGNPHLYYSPDGSRIAFIEAHEANYVAVMNVESQKIEYRVEYPYLRATLIGFRDANTMVGYSPELGLFALDVKTSKMIWQCMTPMVSVDAKSKWSWSRDRQRLAVFDEATSIANVWDVQERRHLLTITKDDLPWFVTPTIWVMLAVVGLGWLLFWYRSRPQLGLGELGQRDLSWQFVCVAAAVAIANGIAIYGIYRLSETQLSLSHQARGNVLSSFVGVVLVASIVAGFCWKFQRFNFALGVAILIGVLGYDLRWFVLFWWFV